MKSIRAIVIHPKRSICQNGIVSFFYYILTFWRKKETKLQISIFLTVPQTLLSRLQFIEVPVDLIGSPPKDKALFQGQKGSLLSQTSIFSVNQSN